MWIPEKKAAKITWCIHVGLLFLVVCMWIVIGHVIMVPRHQDYIQRSHPCLYHDNTDMVVHELLSGACSSMRALPLSAKSPLGRQDHKWHLDGCITLL